MGREAENQVFTNSKDPAKAKELAQEIANSTGRKTTGMDGSGNQQTVDPK